PEVSLLRRLFQPVKDLADELLSMLQKPAKLSLVRVRNFNPEVGEVSLDKGHECSNFFVVQLKL
ncbi:MAG: hypothetical protein WBI10_12455, partial [Syntrophales bacterium]